MSLIFQSLQELDAQAETPPPGIGDAAPDKARSRSIRWLLPVAIGLIVSLILGSGAVYAVQYLKDRLPERTRPSDRLERYEPERDREVPAPIEAVAESEDPPTAVLPPAASQAEPVDEPSGTSRYQFHPPAQEKAPVAPPSVASTEPKDAPPVKMSAALAAGPLPVQAADTETETETPEPKEDIAPVAPPQIDAEREAVEQARRKALEKSARIGRLVRRIEQALAGSTGAGDVRGLLNELARIKGENHPYVAKLRAYYNFQRGEVALAEADLHKVIAANPDDLEAGINLALIEIQDQRYDKALARLKALRRVYPEHEQIADLIKRLQ